MEADKLIMSRELTDLMEAVIREAVNETEQNKEVMSMKNEPASNGLNNNNPKSANPSALPLPIFFAPHIDSMEITLVMGDQKSSYMTFNGGEAYVDELTDDDGDDSQDNMDDGVIQASCPSCRKNATGAAEQRNVRIAGRDAQTDTVVRTDEEALKDAPEFLKEFVNMLRNAGLTVAVRKVEAKNEEEQSHE